MLAAVRWQESSRAPWYTSNPLEARYDGMNPAKPKGSAMFTTNRGGCVPTPALSLRMAGPNASISSSHVLAEPLLWIQHPAQECHEPPGHELIGSDVGVEFVQSIFLASTHCAHSKGDEVETPGAVNQHRAYYPEEGNLQFKSSGT
jgi:hypothetical protein